MRALMLRSSVGRISTLLSHNSACTPSSLGPGSHFDSGTLVTHVTLDLEAYTNDGKANNPRGANEFPELHWFCP